MSPRSVRAAPPRWTSAALRAVLPCAALREAIFGDLHEEFVRESAEIGLERARARYRDRVIGIAAHALWDTFRWRPWASTPPSTGAADRGTVPSDRSRRREWEESLRAAVVRSRAIGRAIGFSVLGLAVLTIGIVVNTSAFAAVEGVSATGVPAAAASSLHGPLFVLAIGAGALALSVVCALAGALVICFGPRWRRGRLERASRP